MAEKRKDKDGRILPENVTQRKDGTYMWRKSVNGKNYCLYAKTLGEIKQKRNMALGEIEKGEFKGKHEKMREERELAKKDITLNEWFFQWEKAYRANKVKQSTLQNDHAGYMRYFSDTLGRLRIKDIKQINVVDVLNGLHENGLAYGSVVRYYSNLALIFQAAVDNGFIEKNPVIGALKLKKESAKERRVLTECEEKRLLDFIARHKDFVKRLPLFIIGFGTGMRIGEILALTWKDIDFEKNIIHINKTILWLCDGVDSAGKQKIIINPPKTEKSIRDIPMLGRVRDAFEEQRKMWPKSNVIIDGYNDFVFTTKAGTILMDTAVRKMCRTIAKLMDREEIETAQKESREPELLGDFSPHCMRHTFATRCYEKGMREKTVQKILGHSKLDMTLNVYTHTTDEMIAEDIQKMEE